MPKPYKGNIEKQTLRNRYYRRVLFTSKEMQLVLMKIRPRDEIGMEVHPKTSQFIRVEGGKGYAVVAGKRYNLKNGDALLVPSKTKHNIIAGKRGLRLYTIYAPPEHPPKTKELTNPLD
uniref:Cupin type-2 domain-containing protein n=1 Tax=viral metagenome TaxID=1070528 RepID=A0A6C0EMC0_9ZZZZ